MNAMTGTGQQQELAWFGDNLVGIPVSAEDFGDGLSVIRTHSPCGESPPLHVHHTQDEVFIVLTGRLRIVVGGKTLILSAGDCALAPKGIAHTYRVESTDGAQYLIVTQGKDFETMIRKMTRPASHAGMPTPAQPTPAAIAALTAACAESAIDIIGPPLN